MTRLLPVLPGHEQKDGGLASDEGVAELIFALGTGLGRSPLMAREAETGRQNIPAAENVNLSLVRHSLAAGSPEKTTPAAIACLSVRCRAHCSCR